MLGFYFLPLNILVHFQDLFPVLAFQPIWFWNELEHNLASNVMAFKCFSSLHYISSKSLNSTNTPHEYDSIFNAIRNSQYKRTPTSWGNLF